jgi:hypothetical protein
MEFNFLLADSFSRFELPKKEKRGPKLLEPPISEEKIHEAQLLLVMSNSQHKRLLTLQIGLPTGFFNN